jgi:hypothetical protein
VDSQPEELEDKYVFKKFEDSINTLQPTPKESKPYQSFFEFENMASPYKGGKRGV